MKTTGQRLVVHPIPPCLPLLCLLGGVFLCVLCDSVARPSLENPTMPVTLTSTVPSAPFAARVARLLDVPLVEVERRDFPDGESYLRLPLTDRSGFIGHTVVLVGATESQTSIDELYRLGCAAVKYGASRLVLAIPYFGYSTMERAAKPGEAVSAKTVARQLSAIPHAPSGNWFVLMDLHASGIVYYFEGDTFTAELYAEPEIVKAIDRLQLPKLCLASADMGRAKGVESIPSFDQ